MHLLWGYNGPGLFIINTLGLAQTAARPLLGNTSLTHAHHASDWPSPKLAKSYVEQCKDHLPTTASTSSGSHRRLQYLVQALSCERLILLGADCNDLRDYGVLLYHCGNYEEALQYLKLYKEAKQTSNSLNNPVEDDALAKLMIRLNLILMEEGWRRRPSRSFFRNTSEPW